MKLGLIFSTAKKKKKENKFIKSKLELYHRKRKAPKEVIGDINRHKILRLKK